MECEKLILNQLIIHCQTAPSDNVLHFDRVNQTFLRNGVFIGRYSDFTIRITRKAYIVLFLFNNIFETYINLEEQVLKYLVAFIDAVSEHKLSSLSYKVKNIHINSRCSLTDQELLTYFIRFYEKKPSLNHDVRVIDETGAEFNIAAISGGSNISYRSIRLRLESVVFTVTFKGKIGIVASDLSKLQSVEAVLKLWQAA